MRGEREEEREITGNQSVYKEMKERRKKRKALETEKKQQIGK